MIAYLSRSVRRPAGSRTEGEVAASPVPAKGLRRFLPLILLIGLLVPFLSSAWYALSLERAALEDSFRYELDRLADVVAEGMSDPVWNLTPAAGQPLLDSLFDDGRILHVSVTSYAQGRFLEGGARPEDGADTRQILLEREIVRDGAAIGAVAMLVDASGIDEALAAQRAQFIAVATGNVLLSVAIVVFILRVSTRLENEANLRTLNRRLTNEIAERKITEDRLKESDARIKAIMENSPSAILLKDLDGRYQVVNPRVREWYGLGEDDLIGKTTADVFPFKDAVAYVSQDREALELDRAVTREYRIRWNDGTRHTIVSTKFPVRDAGEKLIGVGTLNSDITEQRRAEEQLRQTQKLQSLGQLTGGIAHDFNNLLAVIQGNAEMLDEDLVERGEEEEKSLRSIYRAVHRGKELTMRLLAFSRRQPLSPIPVDIEELAEGMADMLRRTLGETIRVRTDCRPTDWQVLADPGQLENAILNLGINARDAMPDGGEITIRTAATEVRDENESDRLNLPVGDYVTISLVDKGVGMPPDVAEKAIEPFFTTKDVGEGTGLGLSMIYGFVKQSSGGMVIDTVEGEGTCVTLYLPRAPVPAPAERTAVSDGLLRGDGQSILVVEDDADLREVAEGILESLGYRVLVAEDARKALSKIGSRAKIDLLLTDVVLPGGFSGPDLVEAALVHRPGLKVLFMSGYAGRSSQDHSLPVGARLLAKPFEGKELARLVAEQLAAQPGNLEVDADADSA